MGFGFGGLFGLIVLGYLVYKIVDCCKRQRTLNRLQSHYQLRDPGAGAALCDVCYSCFP